MREYILAELSKVLKKYVGKQNSHDLRIQLADEIVEVLAKSVKKFPEYPVQDMWEEIRQNEDFIRLVQDTKPTLH